MYVLKTNVLELSAGPGQRNKGTDARVGYLYKLPPSGDLNAIMNSLKIQNQESHKGRLKFNNCL